MKLHRQLHTTDPTVLAHARRAGVASRTGDHLAAARHWMKALAATGGQSSAIVERLNEAITAGYGDVHEYDCRCLDCWHADNADADAHDVYVAGVEHGMVA